MTYAVLLTEEFFVFFIRQENAKQLMDIQTDLHKMQAVVLAEKSTGEFTSKHEWRECTGEFK